MIVNINPSLFWDQMKPLIRLKGVGCRDFLQGQTSADFSTLKAGQLLKSCWLSATGRVRALLEIRLDEEGADVLVLSGDVNVLTKNFEDVIFPADQVQIQEVLKIRRLQEMDKCEFDQNKVEWVLTGQSPTDFWNGLNRADSYQFESWRLKQGLPSWPEELDGETNPFELGLAKWISLSKGCYLGQESLSKIYQTKTLKQQIRFWVSEEVINCGEKLFFLEKSDDFHEKKAGIITSSLRRMDSLGSMGLALIRRKFIEETQLDLEMQSKRVRLIIPDSFVPFPEN